MNCVALILYGGVTFQNVLNKKSASVTWTWHWKWRLPEWIAQRQLSVVFNHNRCPQEIICLDQQEPGGELPARILEKLRLIVLILYKSHQTRKFYTITSNHAFFCLLYLPLWHLGAPWPFSSPLGGRTSPGSPSYPLHPCTPNGWKLIMVIMNDVPAQVYTIVKVL